MKKAYTIHRAEPSLAVAAPWDAAGRVGAQTLEVANFWQLASDHRPRTHFRLLWDDTALHGMFRVEDRYVRAAVTELNGSVYLDSCVEFFVQPSGGSGYCNFEFNCCGVMHASHIENEARRPDGFAKWRPWNESECKQIGIEAPLTGPIPEERVGDCVWTLAFRIPLAPLLACTGAPRPTAGTVWRANVYKCGNGTSHPHWGSWNPVDERNFHLPRCFGEMRFA